MEVTEKEEVKKKMDPYFKVEKSRNIPKSLRKEICDEKRDIFMLH